MKRIKQAILDSTKAERKQTISETPTKSQIVLHILYTDGKDSL